MVTKKDKFLAAAQKFMERGSFEKALVEFQNAVKEDPKDTRTWLRMAEVHVRLGKTDKATEVYQKTVDLYVEQGFFQRAVAVYKNIIKLAPDFVDARTKLAEVYRQLGLLSDAAQQLEQATALLQKSNRLSEALAVLRQIVDLNPDQAAARIRFAEVAAQTGAVKEAVTELREAARMLKTQSKMDEWLRVAERLLHYEPEDAAMAKEVAQAYLDQNNARGALARLKPLFEKEPRNAEVLELLAKTFDVLGQPHKCLPVLKELARVYGDAGRVSERNQTAHRVLQLDPNDAEMAEFVGRASGFGRTGGTMSGVRLVTPLPSAPSPISSTPPAPGRRPMAITFSEMDVPPALRTKYVTPPPPQDFAPATMSEKISIASGMVEKSEDDPEVMRVLAEADVFVKYGLVERAADHLRRVFERVPSHFGAHERLAAVLVQLNRKAEAAVEYETLAQQSLGSNPKGAAVFARKALDLNPAAKRALDVLRVVEGDVAPRPHPSSPIPRQEPARSVEPVLVTPEPEIIESGEIELLPADSSEDGLSMVLDTSGGDEGKTRDDIDPNYEDVAIATPAPLPIQPEARVSAAFLLELEQVDFFIEQNLVDEALGLLEEMEGRFPGHVQLAERRAKVMAKPSLADPSPGAVPALAHDEAAPAGIQPAPSGPFPATKAMGEEDHDLETRADLGIMEKTLERFESAISHFSALLEDAKREVFALTMIGECREALGDSAEAIRCYQEALKRPQATEAEATQLYYQLGSVFHNLGDRSEALYYFERVSKREPNFRDVQRRLAELKARAGAR